MEAASPNGLPGKPEGQNTPAPAVHVGHDALSDSSGTPETIGRSLSRLQVAAAAPSDGAIFAIPSAAAVEQYRRALRANAHDPQAAEHLIQAPQTPEEIGESLSELIARNGFAQVVRVLFRTAPLHQLLDLSHALSDHLCGQDCVSSVQFGGEYDPGPSVRHTKPCPPAARSYVSLVSLCLTGAVHAARWWAATFGGRAGH